MADRRIGRKQADLLSFAASPAMMLLTPGAVSRSLVKRGLMREEAPGGACCITPAGLRALAGALDEGVIDDAFTIAAKRAAEAAEKERVNG